MAGFQIWVVLNVIFRVLAAFIACTGVGAVTGAIIVLQAVDMIANGELFSKGALLHNLLHGKLFIEWVSYAQLMTLPSEFLQNVLLKPD
ncbi:hypothetical protein L1987_40232 [Smallanthus sonchifolius]|uniref:Uncharacterized protein n=1 Tax=Smallanthus sonchifolius TaxID=185202 RepID=A0ACB9GSR9_9ASTR|nr:hypothetical protein L1987_40232 [Smallanthus sonchifolius]